MSADGAELSTIRAQLGDLLVRVVQVADRYRETPDSAVSADLDAAERSLNASIRSIDRALKRLGSLP